MALNHLAELYLTPSPVQHQDHQPSIDEFLDKKGYRWKQLRRVMRYVADKYQLAGLKDPKCDDAVKMVINNVTDMKHLIGDIESNRKLSLLMVKNRAERVRKSLLRKGGQRIYKRKINHKERQRWDAMKNDRRKKSPENAAPETNQVEPTSSLLGETSQVLFSDHYEWQQESPTHQTPWTTPEASQSSSPSSDLSDTSTPRRRSGRFFRSPSPLVRRTATPTCSRPANINFVDSPITNSPHMGHEPTPSSPANMPSPTHDAMSESDGSPTPMKGWKGWAIAHNDEDLIPQKMFRPKSGQRARTRRRILDL